MKIKTIRLNEATANRIKQAAIYDKAVSGLTHNFYRYPARFSPIFANEVITAFTEPGDYILDPFVGGGTALVEARALGRRGIGVDINSLATFITQAKTTLLTPQDIHEVQKWSESIHKNLSLRNKVKLDESKAYYYRNINCRSTWPLRNTIQLAINYTDKLQSEKQITFARCALLNSSQWALESKRSLPSASELRARFGLNLETMLESATNYRKLVIEADKQWENDGLQKVNLFNKSASDFELDPSITNLPNPKLILTSPPYPGVHVLYHRWQVKGRRETPAPYWIANRLDGSGESYYTFGHRKTQGLTSYFRNTYESFRSLAKVCCPNTTVVQMIAFSEPKWQLPLFLETLEEAGFIELQSSMLANSNDGRLWRRVPNRKWHATYKGKTASSYEVVLIHKLDY